MILVSAEHDGFLHAVCLLQVLGDLLGHLPGAVVQDQVIIKIAVGINAVSDHIPVPVYLTFIGAPAFSNVGAHVDYTERRKEAVVNAFPQAVCIDRLAKIINIGDIARFLGRRRHADLGAVGKVFQDLAPVAVLLG